MAPRPVRLLRNLNRGREIVAVLVRHGFGDAVRRLRLTRYVKLGRRVLFWREERADTADLSAPQRLRLALEDLGPTFIKFGQVASTRPDLLPPEVIGELSRLREAVPPFPGAEAVAEVERTLGRPVGRCFRSFETEPFAGGSLGQVHRAVGTDGAKLAVKVRRPGVKAEVERDLSLMFDLASLIERRLPELRVFDPTGLVTHFARTIRREVIFTREARTITEFRRLFAGDPDLHVPAVVPDLCGEAVLTMSWVDGLPADDPAGLVARGLDPAAVAARGARVFLRQVFEFGLFHGDPHPGNVRVMPGERAACRRRLSGDEDEVEVTVGADAAERRNVGDAPAGAVCLLDFGMIGSLDEETRDRLVDLLAAVARRDSAAAGRVLLALGTPMAEPDEAELRLDLRDFLNAYYGVPLDRIRVSSLLHDFLALLSTHRIRLPGDLMLLVRAAVAVEGTGRRLDPGFNLAEHLAPFAVRMIRRRLDPRRLLSRTADEAGEYLTLAREAPHQAARVLRKLSRDEFTVHLEHDGLEHLITEVDRASNRLAISLAMSALILASALLIRSVPESYWFAVPIFLLSSLLGLWLVYGVFRSGSL